MMKFAQYGMAGLVGGAIALTGGATPALAQVNQSDVTGPNLSDITGPNVFDSPGLVIESDQLIDQDTINQANELSQTLEDAYSACLASQTAAGPRRFARGSGPEDCTTTACLEFNQVVSQVEQFLSGLDPEIAEQIAGPLNRLW